MPGAGGTGGPHQMSIGRDAALRRPPVSVQSRNVIWRTPQRGVPTICVIAALLVCSSAFAQTRGGDFQLTKITKNLITTPTFGYQGAQQYPTNQRDRWLEVE